MPTQVQGNGLFIHVPKTGGLAICKALTTESRGHGELGRRCGNRFVFMFVRNPWDRLVSAYHYLRAGGRGFPNDLEAAALLEGYRDFGEFVRALEMGLYEEISSICPHLAPQVRWSHPRIDFVGRFENINADFDEVCYELGGNAARLEVVNPSKHAHYSTYYDNTTRDIVYKRYRADASTYGYTFQPENT